jgi:hypothetical protein
MKSQKGHSVQRTEYAAPLGQSKELLNIPISISLLHEREYANIVRHVYHEKRRAMSEKNKSNVAPIHSYRTEIV